MGPSRQPCFDFFCFVGGVIVHDDVDIQISRDPNVNLLQESQKLFRPMTFVALADDEARSNVKSDKQGRGALADLIMCLTFRNARHHR